MRILIVVCALLAGAAVGVSVLSIAGAQTTTTATVTTTATTTAAAPAAPRTVSVQGVANESIASAASAASANSVYRQGMAEAIADGLEKAQFLAAKAAATLGPVQSVVEDGGDIDCPGPVEYEGAQPDFGFAGGVQGFQSNPPVAERAAPALEKAPSKHRKRRPKAKRASAANCTLSTQVSLTYQLS